MLKEACAEFIEIIGDSLLISNHLTNVFECKDSISQGYREKCQELLESFRNVKFIHVPREQNVEANNQAQLASGFRSTNLVAEVYDHDDWRFEIATYLRNPSQSADKKVRYKA